MSWKLNFVCDMQNIKVYKRTHNTCTCKNLCQRNVYEKQDKRTNYIYIVNN